MTEDVADLDIGSALAAPGRCPGCGSAGLVAMTDGEKTAFACQPCGCCWQFELGWARQVDQRSLRRVAPEPHRDPGPPGTGTPPHGYESTPADLGMPGDEE